MEIGLTILISIVSGSGGGGLLHLLLKTYLTEKIQGEIKNEYDIKFETARKELEKKATEHQIRYSKLHIDRSEKLQEIHDKLIETEDALKYLVSIGQGPDWKNDEGREEKAREQYEELSKIIRKRKIYFNVELCQQLDALMEDYNNVIVEMGVAKTLAKQKIRGDINPDLSWKNQRDRLEGDIKKTQESIQNEFRIILGI